MEISTGRSQWMREKVKNERDGGRERERESEEARVVEEREI